MLEPAKGEVPSKCFFTLGQLPKFSDPKQPPSKTKPFSSILEQPFIHSLDLLLPSLFYKQSNSSITQALTTLEYALVTLSLPSILSNPFFSTYIKSGSIALQSLPPPPGSNSPLITLYNGLLRLELPRDLYERCGLSGQPIRSGGRKHMPERFVVELNLRLPSMVSGRKGFERLKRAADEVLNAEMKFLFADCEKNVDEKSTVSLKDETRPLWAFKPAVRSVEVQVKEQSLLVPEMRLAKKAGKDKDFPDLGDAVFEEEAMDMLEWLDLAMMQSRRVGAEDDIDPFLSRYAVPGTEMGTVSAEDVVCVSWQGFIPSDWVRDMLTLWLNAARKDMSSWVAMSGHLFRMAAVDSKLGWTVLRLPEELSFVTEELAHNESGDEDEAMPDADNAIGSGSPGAENLIATGPAQSTERKPTKPFPQFVLYEMTAGERG